jgi:hypothetical protein
MTWPYWSIARYKIDPAPGDLDIGLIDEPPITWRVPAGLGRINQQRCEPLHPPVDSDMIDVDTTLGQQLFGVTVDIPGA